jgi:hypothetical protein
MRRDGTTTRMADNYIQELFTTGKTEVRDHWYTKQASERLMGIIIRRLKFEHPSTEINVSRSNLTIELKDRR